MNYLKYIEHAAENLQFFLWYREYTRRFEALPGNEKTLSPEWTLEQAETEALAAQTQPRAYPTFNPETTAVFKDTDFASQPRIAESEKANPFHTPSRTSSGESKRIENGLPHPSSDLSTRSAYQRKAEGAFDDAGLKWQPCT